VVRVSSPAEPPAVPATVTDYQAMIQEGVDQADAGLGRPVEQLWAELRKTYS